ncbi:MAG: oligosaccharide flippase family protein [Neisseria sp.]|nr:oligosaccharide flippase family protein [Neisseria sp.]
MFPVRLILRYAAGPVGNAAVGLLLLPVMSWYFSGGDIGRLVLLQTVTGLSLIVLGLGLDQAYVREYHSAADRAVLLKTLAFPPLLLAAALAAALCLWRPQWPAETILSLSDARLGVLCLLFVYASLAARYLSLVLRMQERASAFSLAQVLPKLSALLLIAAAMSAGLGADIFLLLAAYAAGQWAAVAVLLWQTRRDLAAAARAAFSRRQLAAAWSYGLPLALAGVAYWGFTSADRWLLKDLAGLEDVGVYSLATAFGAAALVFQSVFATVWSPLVFKWASQGGDEGRVAQAARHMTAAIAAITGVCGLCSPLAALLLPDAYADVPYILPCTLLSPLLYTLTEVTGIGVHICRRTFSLVLVSLAALAVNLVLLNMFIPQWGARGAAMAAAVSFWLFFAGKTELSARLWQPLPRAGAYGGSLLCLSVCLAYTRWGSAAVYGYFVPLWLALSLWPLWRYRVWLSGRLQGFLK